MMQAWLAKANPSLKDKAKPGAAGDSTTKNDDNSGTKKRPRVADSLAAPTPTKRPATASSSFPVKRKNAKAYPKETPEIGPDYLALERAVMHPSWYWRLAEEFDRPYFKPLKAFVERERASGSVIYPPDDMIYTWARIPFEDIKVVILGQDPYHNPGQAHGLSFSVLPGIAPPPSLINIYKELEADVGAKRPGHGYLMGWARQGVLLLNAVLTVRKNQPASHAKQGWENLTDAVVRHLNEEGENLVFILWGSHAQKKGSVVNRKKHLVITSVHPSPLSAHRGFFGSKPFSKANAYLKQNGKMPIDWSYLPIADQPLPGEDGDAAEASDPEMDAILAEAAAVVGKVEAELEKTDKEISALITDSNSGADALTSSGNHVAETNSVAVNPEPSHANCRDDELPTI